MSSIVTPRQWDGEGLAHEALFFDDEPSLLRRCVPFIQEGLELGQPVLVVASTATLTTFESQLDPTLLASLASFEPSERWWQGAHATMSAYVNAMEPLRAAGKPWRLVAEPTWLAHPGGRYWSRFEAVANVTLSSYPYYSLCLHDRRQLDHQTIVEAHRTHPWVDHGAGPTASRHWAGPEAFLATVQPALEPRPAEAETAVHQSPASVRTHIHRAATDAGLAPDRVGDLVLAADELATNSLAAANDVTVSTWITDQTLITEIHDTGPGFDDTLAGYVHVPSTSPGGRGLWLARALSDDLALRATPTGVTAQLRAQLPPGSAASGA